MLVLHLTIVNTNIKTMSMTTITT